MSLLQSAVFLIVAAFVCYTIAVWSGRFAGRLKPWHLVFLWLGLASDIMGTRMMSEIAGGSLLSLHGIVGLLALALMLLLTLSATVVIWRNDAAALTRFNRFSLVVWLLWLIPFISGMISGMTR